MEVKDKKVFVGLSGGVDSAVTAALLKDAGASVTGVFIKGWYPPGMPCSWSRDRRDAMRVAAHLGIPFKTLDASEEYKTGVIEYLVREYRAGRTPNPDAMCNREVKFGAFQRYAVAEGADFIATGHYARIVHDGRDARLLRGRSAAKDQSYFLWAVPKEALEMTLFPLGEYEKAQVRELARRFNLPVADKPDSQGICFLGEVSIEDFLREEFASEKGRAVDLSGAAVGEHDGAVLHTLGERVRLADAPPGPWFVVRKDMAKNELVVAKSIAEASTAGAVALLDSNWLREPREDAPYEAQYRYHGSRIPVSVDGTRVRGEFPETPAPGQSLVIYDGDEVVGGGIVA